MNKSQLICAFALLLASACLGSSGDPFSSERFSAVLTASRIDPRVVTENRDSLVSLASGRLAESRIDADRLAASPRVTAAVAGGREELVSLLVSCALPARLSVVATIGGLDFEFPGEIGLAAEWARGALGPRERRWVSACAASKISGIGAAVPVSLRGSRRELAAPRAERDAFPLEEGAFFGDVFASTDGSVDWNACRGRGQIPTPTGGLVDRVCAQEDPASPGLTRCGFVFVGDCADACDLDRERGFYRRCRSRGAISTEIVTAYASP